MCLDPFMDALAVQDESAQPMEPFSAGTAPPNPNPSMGFLLMPAQVTLRRI